jgi:hypothetical protein
MRAITRIPDGRHEIKSKIISRCHPSLQRGVIHVNDSIQAMLVALFAVLIGLVFNQFGSNSIFFSIVGKIFIMGAFIISVTAFLVFMKDWIVTYRTY